MKEEYANYLGEENHLIAVTASANRSKGAKGPEEWGPPELGYWCQYATDWAEIKEWWELTMTKVESEIVMDMLGTCENPPEVDVREALESATGEHKPEAAEEPQNSVYGLSRGGVRGGVQVPGEPGWRLGFPQGDGSVRSGRGWGWSGVRKIATYIARKHNSGRQTRLRHLERSNRLRRSKRRPRSAKNTSAQEIRPRNGRNTSGDFAGN